MRKKSRKKNKRVVNEEAIACARLQPWKITLKNNFRCRWVVKFSPSR
jgi:hypothetical protein